MSDRRTEVEPGDAAENPTPSDEDGKDPHAGEDTATDEPRVDADEGDPDLDSYPG